MKEILKKNYKFIITLLIILFALSINFPYYIDAPGGITNMNEKIEIDGYESSGSFNLVYVREYKATIPTLLIALFNNDWEVLKNEEVLLEEDDDNSYQLRDKILIQESISNAIYVAYSKANKKITQLSNELIVTYTSSNANTDLMVGDEIISINDNPISSKDDIANIINSYEIGTRVNIEVINNDKKYDRYAYIIDEDNSKKIGILVSNIREYETKPKVSVNIDSNESGSSGGLITALSIYNSLVSEDITKGLTIVGTGTIDLDGNIGSIGGVEYKLKSAVKEKADLFIVPNDDNYKKVLKLKKENNYDIKILGVSTFDEVIDYLNKL